MEAWSKIEDICQENNIAEICFIMDRFELHSIFCSMSGNGSDVHRSKMARKTHAICLLPMGKSVNILVIRGGGRCTSQLFMLNPNLPKIKIIYFVPTSGEILG